MIEVNQRLEAENRTLLRENEQLRATVQELESARGLNERAYTARLASERDDLATEVKVLREKVAKQEAQLLLRAPHVRSPAEEPLWRLMDRFESTIARLMGRK